MKLTRVAFEDLVAGDVGWLMQQPRTLERDHILEILRGCVDHHYPAPRPMTTDDGFEEWWHEYRLAVLHHGEFGRHEAAARAAYTAALARQAKRIEALEKVRKAAGFVLKAEGTVWSSIELTALRTALADPALGK